MANNDTMMQYFHWNLPADGTLWNQIEREAGNLAAAGITALWLPPPTKGTSGSDVGYGAYDLWDLGEFDQKGSVRTKYGTRAELEAGVRGAHAAGLRVYIDVVFNHKGGADATERVRGTPVNPDNRNQTVGEEREIETWTVFDFPGRGDRYSSLKWRWWHFDAVDYDQLTRSIGTIYRLREKGFDTPVGGEFGNYDYLLFADIDMDSEEARADLHAWGEWIVRTLDVDGFRFDAVKHVRSFFFNEWLDALRRRFPAKAFFSVGEHFTGDPATLGRFLEQTGQRMSLFDFPLFFNLRAVSHGNGSFDMRNLVHNTLVAQSPEWAVTFVSNHDVFRNPDEDVADWFKPLAYAFILLRDQGYPCVFYGDYYGTPGRTSHRVVLDALLAARRDHAYGPQQDYFDHENVVGWTRLGDEEHPKAMAVVMSDGPGGDKTMLVGRHNAAFRDITGHITDTITSDGNGSGVFPCNGGSVSVWVEV
ncbi:alpha-amylase [Candidatus Thiosymbion oneisti]|uniref:alpha-amylase n=1 Tax=Candidatus Thiosymbion oneisti TaxID=589554 RepID=UPI000AED7EC7|nr:alpha-amylase [Candidatus Thiosymbion oneisti]